MWLKFSAYHRASIFHLIIPSFWLYLYDCIYCYDVKCHLKVYVFGVYRVLLAYQ